MITDPVKGAPMRDSRFAMVGLFVCIPLMWMFYSETSPLWQQLLTAVGAGLVGLAVSFAVKVVVRRRKNGW